ncbi:MAG: hydrogenase maturation protease [Candidatus Omnitrophota bacterium]
MSEPSCKKYAVIGLGNVLRSDDGIGIKLLEALRQKWQNSDIAFQDFGIASFDLAHHIEKYDAVLLIDAIDAELEPGELKIFQLSDVHLGFNEKKLSSHELALSDLLRLCETLGVKAEICIAGIQVKNVDYGLQMTSELEAVQARLVDEISCFIESWFK